LHALPDGLAQRGRLRRPSRSHRLAPYLGQVIHRRSHSRDILEDERACLDLAGWLIRDEVLAKGRQRAQRLITTPHETHVRSEDLVSGADQVVTTPGLNIDESVGGVVHAVKEYLRSHGVRDLCGCSYIDD